MVRRLDMHKTRGIEHLFAIRMSKQEIARTLGIDRRSVDRFWPIFIQKGPFPKKRPSGKRPLTLVILFLHLLCET